MNIERLHPIEDAMHTRVMDKIKAIEAKHNVRIIYACESGSRAWGFASPDSDYDVRFIYVRPPEDYVGVAPARDVIEEKIDDMLDINGWDIIKAAKMLHKGNPTLLEWLSSPIVYQMDGNGQKLRHFSNAVKFKAEAAWHHYFAMGYNSLREHFSATEISPKKYFYAIRAALASDWVRTKGVMAPVPLATLLEETTLLPVGHPVRDAVIALHAEKISTKEMHKRPPIPVLVDFLYAYFTERHPPFVPDYAPVQGKDLATADGILEMYNNFVKLIIFHPTAYQQLT